MMLVLTWLLAMAWRSSAPRLPGMSTSPTHSQPYIQLQRCLFFFIKDASYVRAPCKRHVAHLVSVKYDLTLYRYVSAMTSSSWIPRIPRALRELFSARPSTRPCTTRSSPTESYALRASACGFIWTLSSLWWISAGDFSAMWSTLTQWSQLILQVQYPPTSMCLFRFNLRTRKSNAHSRKSNITVMQTLKAHRSLNKSVKRTKYALTHTRAHTNTMWPTGQIGLLVSSKESGKRLDKPCREADAAMLDQLKYYSPEIHSASVRLSSKSCCVKSKKWLLA